MTQSSASEQRPIIEVDVTNIAHGGAALGRHGGRVIFVQGAIPGEMVRAEVVEDRGRYANAKAVEVLVSSPDRVVPRCPHVPECGGCQWQHIDYSRQLALKAEIVRDQLVRIGGISDPPVRATWPSPSPWYYRNRVTFGVSDTGQLGFQQAGSHAIVPIFECHIADERLMEVYDDLDLDLPELTRLTLLAGADEDDVLLAFETENDQAPSLSVDLPLSCVHLVNGEQAVPVNLLGRNHVTMQVAGYTYRVSAGRFFQVNTGAAEILVNLVLEFLAPSLEDAVLDAYAGVGLFTLPLADRTGAVIAVEIDPGATEDLITNLGERENVDVIEGPVEVVLPDVLESEPLHGVVVDPPRQGLNVAVVDALVEAGPPRLVYVSCDPATLARDLKRLAHGGYVLEVAQPVDIFPQTFHIETVARLVRTS